jgi:hypothetical protein
MNAYGPKTVTDGLVLHLDAGNTKSYPGSGTAWNDLSGRNNHATMYGTAPFETDVSRCFNFATATGTGASDCNMGFYFSGGNMVPTTGSFTFECWIKNPPASGQTGMFSNAGGGDGYRFGVGYDGVYYLVGPNYTEGGIGWTSGTLVATNWYHIVTTWDRTGAYVVNAYKNGRYENYGSMPTTQTASTNASPGIVRSQCCGIYTGKIGAFKVYNRLLSASEIFQNFNATKGRFGL